MNRPTRGACGIENSGEFPAKPNPREQDQTENPGALAGATGAIAKPCELQPKAYHAGADAATEYPTRDSAKAASAAMLLALRKGAIDAWLEASRVWVMALTDDEREALAFSALSACDPDRRRTVFDAAHGGPEKYQLTPFDGTLQQARDWAATAHRHDLKCAAAAAFERLSDADRRAFLSWAKRQGT